MSETHVTATEHDKPWRCELRIKGHLDDRWADWFEGLTITLEENGDLINFSLISDLRNRTGGHSAMKVQMHEAFQYQK